MNVKNKEKLALNIVTCLIIVFIIIISSLIVKTILNIAAVDNDEDTVPANAYLSEYLVCLDAGHGGSDTGALNGERLEKDDNLRLTLAVQEYLISQGISTVLTRNSDSDTSLQYRTDFANSQNADLFISLHRNSGNSDSCGVEIWLHSSAPPLAVSLAENILSNLSGAGISENRGIYYGYRDNPNTNYHVNRETNMTSCLLEMGFITNDYDNKLFDKHIEDYAKAIGDGIISMLDEIHTADNTSVTETAAIS